MSIATELDRIKAAKSALMSAINNKGGTLTGDELLGEYADAIANLPSGGSADFYKCAEVGVDMPEPVFAESFDGKLDNNFTQLGSAPEYQTIDGRQGMLCKHSHRLQLFDSNLPSGNAPRTLSAWIYFNSAAFSTEWNFFCGYGGVEAESFYIAMRYGELMCYCSEPYPYAPWVDVPKTTWKHIVLSFDGDGVTGYIDGVQIGYTACAYATNVVDYPLAIGWLGTGSSSYGTNAYISDMRIYDVALTPAQVAELYQPSPSSIAPHTWNGYKAVLKDGGYSFEKILTTGLTYDDKLIPQKNCIYDSACTSKIGHLPGVIPADVIFHAPLSVAASTAETGQSITTTGTVTYKDDCGIPAAVFTGNSSNYLSFADAGLPIGATSRTLSIWVKPSASMSDVVIFNYGADSSCQRFGLFLHDSLIHAGIGGYGVEKVYHFDLNKWYNVTLTLSGSTVTFYVNGKVIGIDTLSTPPNTTLSGTGYICHRNGEAFSGSLAAFRIYNRVLSAEEIAELAAEFTPLISVLISPNNLTSNTSNPEWEAFSSTPVSMYTAYKAFDGNLIGTGTGEGFLSSDTPAHVGIRRIDSPVTVTAYGVCPWIGSVGNVSPTSWEFQGSQDGSEWVTLDSQTDISLATSGTEYKYPLAFPAKYEYYRLLMKTSDNRNSWKGVGEFMLYGYQE